MEGQIAQAQPHCRDGVEVDHRGSLHSSISWLTCIETDDKGAQRRLIVHESAYQESFDIPAIDRYFTPQPYLLLATSFHARLGRWYKLMPMEIGSSP